MTKTPKIGNAFEIEFEHARRLNYFACAISLISILLSLGMFFFWVQWGTKLEHNQYVIALTMMAFGMGLGGVGMTGDLSAELRIGSFTFQGVTGVAIMIVVEWFGRWVG